MSAAPDRRAELIAAAVGDDLDDAEAAELRRLAASDPTIDDEIAELRSLTMTLGSRGPTDAWLESSTSPDLRERILGATGSSEWSPQHNRRTQQFGGQRFGGQRFGAQRRSAGLAVAAAVVGVVVGSGVVLGVDAYRQDPTNPPAAITGPPGTLGAYEQVAFTTEVPSVDIEGGLVAHTWGTETVLEMDGISDRGPYEVVLVDRSGVERPSGTFLGSDITIECRMNAAVLRQDVTDIEIRTSGGAVLARAQLPTAS
ncbi:hypothetical protein O4160_14630 [Rhodococcus sp. IEGM 1401]|uniref:hypothetical protein n=1 Tax=unclassified Rhodococcus (in: high G+C Gram-positive bacteria) TaxID=192944 RepID=UPI0022B34E3A|nr:MULTISPECIES: hypothetical protein [unclassified Rhodococcus (in: high G+C Gram-positive bacteria)]MCZ4562073.1 hypothetical protein [Rhodococcus sp. IEGM 1401]MDI9922115.1 hypothetical protein [Rhodococcus sp. IEGM 1372]MDV8034668.1 hypothetical protein [Rhodococcus sp. IEGM 1414]